MLRRLLMTGLLLFVTSSLQAENWTRFRGEGARGIGGQDIPTTWNDSENLAWKTSLPGKGSSSPVVFGDRIFLTCFTGYGLDATDPGDRANLKLHVLCLSRKDGEIMWNKSIDPSPEEQEATKRVADHGYASPTPCVDEKHVYAAFGPSGLVALTHDGELLWRQSYGTKTAGFGAAASPIVFADTVIMNGSIESSAVYAFDKVTGQQRWKSDEITRAWTTPTIVQLESGESEMIVNQKEAIYGLDPKTGKRLWHCDAIMDYIVPCVVADGETVYCSGGRDNKTFVVKAGGRGDVSDSHLVWSVSKGANVTSPVLLNGNLYWAHDKSMALCLDASDGELMFRERLPTSARVYASIVSDGEKLFLSTRDSGVLVLAASPQYKELSLNKLGSDEERFNATPAIVGKQLLLRSDRALYCVSSP